MTSVIFTIWTFPVYILAPDFLGNCLASGMEPLFTAHTLLAVYNCSRLELLFLLRFCRLKSFFSVWLGNAS